MHADAPIKQVSPDKWLADLLSKALLLEYQQPDKKGGSRRKVTRKKSRITGKHLRARAPVAAADAGVQPQLALDGLEYHAASRYRRLSSKGMQPSSAVLTSSQQSSQWQLEEVPVFQLFTRVRRLLGR